MKIGILTLPLYTNYGGLLQAFALQTVLKRMGHKPLTVAQPRRISLLRRILSVVKRLGLLMAGHKGIVVRAYPTAKENKIIGWHTDRFIDENISVTEIIDSSGQMSLLKKYGFEAYVVGSDQVWRPDYAPCITNYFLDFLGEKEYVKRIAYAASFGVDNWKLSPKETSKCATLARRFNSISVREDSGVALCKEHLGVGAEQVLDPTMLLSKEDYIDLIEKDNIAPQKGVLMTYVLDKAPEKNTIIQRIATELELNVISVMPRSEFSEVGKKNLEDCVFPPVTEWLRGFWDAEYIVTDSFHGIILSIIFNKPFIAIGNKERGLARFTSLLKKFGLEERLILSPDELKPDYIHTPIDFPKVNVLLKNEQLRAINFLSEALK
ncbi:polysaccharide pyruvyl transferase family protein [uncultured Bacteroides sp.]|uniref:polysaccharide pyruvyl transferase family protein n=1 Tax=uncultured Bacteroides sp. TaxID=162156 RepID=UPI002AA830EF|nr:polysaccharide pyruvyl transferase family protein [uncultured Bacteroides sp.]